MSWPAFAHADDGVLSTLSASMDEAVRGMASQPDAPYYLSYAVVDEVRRSVQATHGAIGARDETHSRNLDVDVRVGSMQLDNTHKLRDSGWFGGPERPIFRAPLGPPDAALRRLLLRSADEVYRSARKQLLKVRGNDAVKVAAEDPADDFSPTTPVVLSRPLSFTAAPSLDDALRSASAIFLDYPDVYDSYVRLDSSQSTRWLVTNEGTRLLDGRQHLRVSMWATTIAEDGMQLDVYDYVDVASADHLPTAATIQAMTRGVADRVTALRKAPLVEPWSGPAILRGRAAGVFFHEIFGHRIEGHRQKDEEEGQTFTHRVGLPVLPTFLSVVDDPTVATRAGQDLNGTYAHDDEGVPAQRVDLVDHGILKGFLMSRSPIEGFGASNGHGRREPGHDVVARQGNLMVVAHQSVAYDKLRAQLLDEVRKQKKSFGLIFDDISGGFTFTGRASPQAFDVMPVTVWRVWADGRPDELVRGVDLIGTPLTTFSRITSAADDVDVFNGVCGAESGWVPVSASSPSLLVSEVEIQRREKGNDRPPILPVPPRSR